MSAAGGIELVCFDLGGVLVQVRVAWSDLCRATRLEVRGDSAGEAAERARQEVIDAYTRGDLTTEQWIAAMSKALGSLYSAEEIAALHDAVILEEYAGVGQLIDDLHRSGIATACLSNTNAAHWATLLHHDGAVPLPGAPRHPGVRKLGSHHASHLMRLAKPAPAIYRAFEGATGRAGSKILFFDDREENVDAARTVGWHAEIVDPAASTDEQLRRHLAKYRVL